MEKYEIIECLQKINGREVLLVTEKATGKHLVIKKIKLSQMKDTEQAETFKEVQALQKLQHEYIVSYIWSFKDDATRTINIVMSYCPGGDLYDLIEKHREDKTSFSTINIVDILRQLCEALAYIHRQKILHRDIKPRNIFVENSRTVKLGDFGIAKILDSTSQDADTHNIGTFPYTAPEIFSEENYRQKCDMWSLGCVLYEMITLEQPFQAKVWHELISQITNDPYPPLPVHVDENLAKLVAELLHKDPRERPDAEQVLERQFVELFDVALGTSQATTLSERRPFCSVSSVTCLTCGVAFQDANLGRRHYKTEWHRYNLKRKVAGLSQVSLEKFKERQQLQETQEQENTSSHEATFCKPCNKIFSTLNSYENHIRSKKHIKVNSGAEKPKRANKQPLNDASASEPSVNKTEVIENTSEVMEEDDSDAESWKSCEDEAFGLDECLFCSKVSSSMQENVSHMTAHGFFLPDAEYICNLEGLITYLGEKVALGYHCLWCNEKGKRFRSTKNVQKHMIDKDHCKMFYEGDIVFEYSDFYDYTSSYGKDKDQQVDPNKVVSLKEFDGHVLPSYSLIEDRSLGKFLSVKLDVREPTITVFPKVLADYKPLGWWPGFSGFQVEQRAKDVQCKQRMRNYTNLGCRGNNLRHHFRDPNGLI